MLLKEIMTTGVEFLKPTATLKEAARKMKDCKIGSIVVCNDSKVVGMITDRDIVVRALAMGADPAKEIVGNIMTSPIIFCYEDQSIEEAAQLMEEKGIRRLPVLNRERKMSGIVTLSDVAVDGHNKKLTGRVLESISIASVH